MRLLLLYALCAIALSLPAYADSLEYQVESVDPGQSTITLKSKTLQEVTLQVSTGADITINGKPAGLGDLKPDMIVKVTLFSPGVAQSIESDAMAAGPEVTPIPSVDAMPDPTQSDDQSGKSLKVIITPKSPDAFIIKNVRKGVRIEFHYISGTWRAGGTNPNLNPDFGSTGDGNRLAIALPSSGGQAGEVVAVVPPGTQLRGFIFEAQQDYPSLVLRINNHKFHGPGAVVYDLHIMPPQE